MHIAARWRQSAGFGLAALACVCAMPSLANADEAATVQAIVSAFANGLIQRGVAVGVGVGVIEKISPGFDHTYTFGDADAVTQTPFAAGSIFAIGSTTKVFTTNLLGQAVFENRLRLDNTLSQFQRAFGMFVDPVTSRVSLEELGDFTAGFPSLAPICRDDHQPQTTGCLPSRRPTIADYGAADFLTFFRNFIEPTALPASYEYSDFSTGLLGLFLGTASDQPITDSSLDGWYAAVGERILTPLGMTSTFLRVPAVQAGRVAKGYHLATASAELGSGGAISQINLKGGGFGYDDLAPPQVTIAGGGGVGATATATVKKGRVTGITVNTGGSGYVEPPRITFNGGGSTKTAYAIPIISGGAITAVLVPFEGAGYTNTPQVTIKGGGGSGAMATAHLANGRVVAVTIGQGDGGSGYPDPLTVTVAPGAPQAAGVPIWGAAGSLKSTLGDLMRFAAAALTDGPGQPETSLTAGFRIAETAYACVAKDHPALANCPATSNLSGLAWGIIPADVGHSVPEVVLKDGGLGGYSSEVFLLPERQLAVVVLVNSRSPAQAPLKELAFRPAETLAHNIGYNLLFAPP
jgi:CubicO group peptidase (beta-lactamase class C family)